jgi:hypothetical protein
MPDIKNCVAVDWRQGKDRSFFFFKDTNTYSRFNNADNAVPAGYPAAITEGSWKGFHTYARSLRFGFTLTVGFGAGADRDDLLLFCLEGDKPILCTFNQEKDETTDVRDLAGTEWKKLGPYFEKIVAGVWWGNDKVFLFLMNDGNYLRFTRGGAGSVEVKPIDNTTWPGVAAYKHEMVTAVQFDHDFLADSVYYIFLTGNRYLKYNIDKDKFISGPHPVNDSTWPGLLRN